MLYKCIIHQEIHIKRICTTCNDVIYASEHNDGAVEYITLDGKSTYKHISCHNEDFLNYECSVCNGSFGNILDISIDDEHKLYHKECIDLVKLKIISKS